MTLKNSDYSEYDDDTWEFGAWKAIREHDLDVPSKQQPMEYERLYEAEQFAPMARKAWIELRKYRPDWNINDMVSLVSRKQHDYGPGNIKRFGRPGVLVRLWDKVARYQELTRRELVSGETNEPIDETLVDIIGYIIIVYMVQNGSFDFPLMADKVGAQ